MARLAEPPARTMTASNEIEMRSVPEGIETSMSDGLPVAASAQHLTPGICIGPRA
jgi:hypothetical protein